MLTIKTEGIVDCCLKVIYLHLIILGLYKCDEIDNVVSFGVVYSFSVNTETQLNHKMVRK